MKLHWSWASGLALVLSTDMLYVFCFILYNWVLAKCMDSGRGKTRPEVSIQIERYKSRRAQALEIPCLGLHALPLMEYYFTGWQKNIIIIDKNLVTHSSLLICLGHLACKRQTLLLAHGRWGTFHEEEHLRLSSRNSIFFKSSLLTSHWFSIDHRLRSSFFRRNSVCLYFMLKVEWRKKDII